MTEQPISLIEVKERLFSRVQETRLAAMADLDRVDPRLAQELLMEALEHWDRRTRAAAAEKMARLYGAESAPILLKKVASLQLPRRLTLRLLTRNGGAAMVPYLAQSLRPAPAPLGETWLARLARAAQHALGWRIKNENYWLRECSRELLERLDSPEAILARWEIDGELPGRKMRLVSMEKIERFLRGLDPKLARALLKHPRARRFFAMRNSTGLYPSFGLRELSIKERVAAGGRLSLAKVLAEKTGIRPGLFGWALAHRKHLDKCYQEFTVPKSSGGVRTIAAPCLRLKTIQRGILHGILEAVPVHEACHGFRKEHSIAGNAALHVGKEVVINLDLKDFFPSISAARVYGVLKGIGLESDEAHLITACATRNKKLPQGAPTSPALANLVCRRLDSRLAGVARKMNATYSRYADDLSFSGDASLPSALPLIRRIIAEEGFQMAKGKTRITRPGNRQEVTGLTVNQRVSVPRPIRKRLRAAVHRAEAGLQITWNDSPMTLEEFKGHLAYLGSIHPELAAKWKALLRL